MQHVINHDMQLIKIRIMKKGSFKAKVKHKYVQCIMKNHNRNNNGT